jgi:cytochrome P450
MFNNLWARLCSASCKLRDQIWTGRTFKLSNIYGHFWNYLALTAAAMTMSDCCAIMRETAPDRQMSGYENRVSSIANRWGRGPSAKTNVTSWVVAATRRLGACWYQNVLQDTQAPDTLGAGGNTLKYRKAEGDHMATATAEPVRLPPGPRVPKTAQGIAFLLAKHEMFAALGRRYGGAFTVNMPIFGQTVVISDRILIKDLFSTSSDLVERPAELINTGAVLGPGSMFSLAGDELVARRRLLVPPFHGKQVRSYGHIIEDEVMREIATWPEGREFETLQPMLRITLNAILRAVFGAEGPVLDELRGLLPAATTFGSRLIMVPPVVRRDLGRWSPGGRFLQYRRRIDAVIDSLIADARADPALEERSDVLALLLQARYENGEPICDRHIADELLTMVAAGHETTATTLAWAVERLRRHPRLLSRLTHEVDAGGSELRQATIWEVQRTRPVVDGSLRRTKKRIRLGDWVIPQHTTVIFSIQLAHFSEESFPDGASFNPDRFVGAVPKPFAWIPFGGGVNRCIGAAFANMEMDVALRILLRELRFASTDAPGEWRRNRGVVRPPGRGGRAVVYRRTAESSSDADPASVADYVSWRLGNRSTGG